MIINISGQSGSGKTSLVTKLYPIMQSSGNKVTILDDLSRSIYESDYSEKYSSFNSLLGSRSKDSIEYQLAVAGTLCKVTKENLSTDDILLCDGGVVNCLVVTNMVYHSLDNPKLRKRYYKQYTRVMRNLGVANSSSTTIHLSSNNTSVGSDLDMGTGLLLSRRDLETSLFTKYSYDSGSYLFIKGCTTDEDRLIKVIDYLSRNGFNIKEEALTYEKRFNY